MQTNFSCFFLEEISKVTNTGYKTNCKVQIKNYWAVENKILVQYNFPITTKMNYDD